MTNNLKTILEQKPIEASAPCRIDMGGTLDIPIFYYPLHHLNPCTFNIALGLRTRVRLLPFTRGFIKISSRGFRSAEFPADAAPFDHPLGLMFATAAYFNAGGVHIEIESGSPPRSALGGSSAAAVALVAAFLAGSPYHLNRRMIALLAYKIEETTAGVPCGFQDQLAAAYGGANLWHWQNRPDRSHYRREVAVRKKDQKEFERHLLLAYCGKPHRSKDVNGRWVRQFLAGGNRTAWKEIIDQTHRFAAALKIRDYRRAALHMNREVALRREMTPEVLDEVGVRLVETALHSACGARFTGAGGGGCVWALGEIENVDRLRPLWEEILSTRKEARLLDVSIDAAGVVVH